MENDHTELLRQWMLWDYKDMMIWKSLSKNCSTGLKFKINKQKKIRSQCSFKCEDSLDKLCIVFRKQASKTDV